MALYDKFLTEYSHEFYQYLIDNFADEVNYHLLSENPNITWDIIKAHPDKPWNYKNVSRNPNITWDIVVSNPDEPWDYEYLSLNPNITMEIVLANPDKEFVLNFIGDYQEPTEDHPETYLEMTVEMIQTNTYNFELLSLNPNIPWEIVRATSDRPWNYELLCLNPNITPRIVENNPDKPWDYSILSENLNTTWEFVKANQDANWDYNNLQLNPMPTRKDDYIRKCFQKHFMRHGLAEELMKVVWHPRNFEKFRYLDSDTFEE